MDVMTGMERMEIHATGRRLPPVVMAREDHERLSDLAAAALSGLPEVGQFLLAELDRARVVEGRKLSPKVVRMNSRVEFRDDQTGRCRTVQLVYPGQQDMGEGRLSVLTPIGSALIGLSEGQSIAWQSPKGDRRTLTVLKVGPAEG